MLVVDDSENARAILSDLLAQLQSPHACADSAEAALLELDAARGEHAFDLVLIDWKMPGVDGFELARRIRARAGRVRPRLALVTAFGDEALSRRALDEGFDTYLDKPVSLSTLARALGEPRKPDAPTPPGRPPAAAGEAPLVGRIQGHRILLVDDNELNRILARELLHSIAGAVVTEAHDGARAVELARAEHFDLVLMDVQMPVMDGYEATRRLRAEPSLARLPIIGMTAHVMADDHAQCLAAGMDAVVVKPIEPEAFLRVIAEHLPSCELSARQADVV